MDNNPCVIIFLVLKGFNKYGCNYDDVSKFGYSRPFWNECISKRRFQRHNSFHDATNKIFSCDSNYTVDVDIWPKFGSASISMRAVIITSILQRFDQERQFIWGGASLVEWLSVRVRTKWWWGRISLLSLQVMPSRQQKSS